MSDAVAATPSVRLVLVRHPPVDPARHCYGRLDLPLADPASAAALAAQLAEFGGMVWTSPAQRCRLVAEAVGPYRVDERLQELDFGAWEGQRWGDVPRASLEAWAADVWRFSPPGGETGAALVERVAAFYRGLAAGVHVVISHGGPLKVLAALARGRPVDLLAPSQPFATVVSM